LSGGREVVYGLGAYAAYLAVRRRVWNQAGRERAMANAHRVLSAERLLGVDVEQRVQRLALRAPRLVDVLNAGYAAGNVGLSVGWLLALHHRGDDRFRNERRAAMTAFMGALPFFAAFPTAPPRSLEGFVDTLRARGWNLDHRVLTRFYNPIAAMPSHHVAFAVVTGLGRARHARSRFARVGWRSYPLAVSLVVIATGNHFVADAAAGALLGITGRAVGR
jgi:hypothetical protein